MRRVALAVLACVVALWWRPSMSEAAEPVLLHAAGSLRTSLDEVAAAYEKATGIKVIAKYGASGTLREEIERGTKAEVFASANMEHPLLLARAGKSSPVALFARNQVGALGKPGVRVTPANLLDRMMEANVKLGTSTPRADPSGDYAWEVFRKADKLRPGAFAMLERKALKLVGGPDAPTVPPGRTVYGMLIADGKADLFLTYCTNAAEAQREIGGAQIVALPEELAVGADYGLTVI